MSNTALCITLSKVSYTCWIFLTSSWSCFNFCLAEFSFLGDIKWKKKMKIYFNGFIERMESKNKRQNRTEKQKKQNKTKITSRNAFRNLSSHFRSIIQRKKIRRYSKSIRDRKSIFFSISSTRRSSCYVNYINCNHYLRWSHCSGEKASLLLLNT